MLPSEAVAAFPAIPDERVVPGDDKTTQFSGNPAAVDCGGTAVMAWLVLIVSGLLETVWAVALESSKGFSRLVPGLVFGVALLFSRRCRLQRYPGLVLCLVSGSILILVLVLYAV